MRKTSALFLLVVSWVTSVTQVSAALDDFFVQVRAQKQGRRMVEQRRRILEEVNECWEREYHVSVGGNEHVALFATPVEIMDTPNEEKEESVEDCPAFKFDVAYLIETQEDSLPSSENLKQWEAMTMEALLKEYPAETRYTVGQYTYAEIAKAYEMAEDNAMSSNSYDVLHNNCSEMIVSMLQHLQVKMTFEAKEFIMNRILSHNGYPTLVKHVVEHADFEDLFEEWSLNQGSEDTDKNHLRQTPHSQERHEKVIEMIVDMRTSKLS